MSRQIIIDTSAYQSVKGFPRRTYEPEAFELNRALMTIELTEERAITIRKQCEYFNIASKDASGWFMVIQANGQLDYAKHIAANICKSYIEREMSVLWTAPTYSTKEHLDKTVDLFVLDALFDDANPARRDLCYDMLTSFHKDASAILLCRSESVSMSVNQIGLRPNMIMSVSGGRLS